ncbi:MAG: hypothetical protein JXB88_03265 [Spirochaetales bacterium]|nr:hypothetical protein [Spirochaetales bacterium]
MNENYISKIIITWGGRREEIEVPEFIESIFAIIKDHGKSDGEKLVAILKEIDGMKINVRNSLLKKIRNADIRAKIDSMMGGEPRLEINEIKRQVGREYGLGIRQVENIMAGK